MTKKYEVERWHSELARLNTEVAAQLESYAPEHDLEALTEVVLSKPSIQEYSCTIGPELDQWVRQFVEENIL